MNLEERVLKRKKEWKAISKILQHATKVVNGHYMVVFGSYKADTPFTCLIDQDTKKPIHLSEYEEGYINALVDMGFMEENIGVTTHGTDSLQYKIMLEELKVAKLKHEYKKTFKVDYK